MITIKDIAKAAGVSYASVSRALNNKMSADNPALEKIQKIAKELGYEKNALATGLVTKKTNTIGVVLPDLRNPFFTSILSSINRLADKSGYTLLICNTDWDSQKEKREISTLTAKRVDGILLYPSYENCGDELNSSDMPMVVFGKNIAERALDASFVEVDNRQGGEIAVVHMLDCGYRRLAYIGGPDYSASNVARLESFLRKHRELGIEVPDELVTLGEYSIESGHEIASRLMRLPEERRPDGLICADDLIALGAMHAISEAGIRMPEEVGVLGFDDVPYASLPQIQLTTVKIPCTEMGEAGMKLLMEMIQAKETNKKLISRTINLSTRLISRLTTRRAKLSA